MWWFASNIRAVYWVAIVPAVCSFLLAWLALREPEQHLAPLKRSPFFAGFKQLDKETRRLLAVGFLFTLARFSEGFLILKGIEIERLPDVEGLPAFAAPVTEPWIYDGRIVVRQR